MKNGRVENKVAVVTGAGSGIGRATAELLAREGAQVIAADLVDAGTYDHPAIRYMQLDVADEDRWRIVVAEIGARYGGVNILINNAGTGNLEAVEEESADG